MIFFTLFISIGWAAFWVYWLVSALMSKKTIRNGFWWRGALVRAVIFIFIIFLLQEPSTNHFFVSPLVHSTTARLDLSILGLILWLLGVGLAVWARIHLGKNWGMPMTVKKDRELVTSGPYAYVRHPIYSGVLLGLFGSIFILGLSWLVAFIFFGIYFIYSATREEKMMVQEFPDVYPAYKKRTKMLIPFIL